MTAVAAVAASGSGYRVGVDVGGTFTDVIVHDPAGREVAQAKAASRPDAPAVAVLQGLDRCARTLGRSLDELLPRVSALVHGTTIATNAVLTRTGAVTALLTTEGFRDILQMRRGLREDPYDNTVEPPVPLVARAHRYEVTERVDAAGAELVPLTPASLRGVVESLPGEVEAVAVALLHANVAPAHEQASAEAVLKARPSAFVCASSDLSSVTGLYQRTSTAVLNAYVGPAVSRYLDDLERRLALAGFAGALLVMQSNGGVCAPGLARRQPVTTFLSGPSAGPIAARREGRRVGLADAVVVDMGGTSFECSVMRDGAVPLSLEAEVDRWAVAVPMLAIHTIGSGGGSIAHVEPGGLLRVGPESAGAVPGPACYGHGGDRATVTDADLLLGLLSAGTELAGGLRLSVEAATAAVAAGVARPLGIEVADAAAGIYEVVANNMAEAVREITTERGVDPRALAMVVGGGAGPVHGCAIADRLSITRLVVPGRAAVLCASGLLDADYEHHFERPLRVPLAEVAAGRVQGTVDDLRSTAVQRFAEEGVPPEDRHYHYELALRYASQWFDVTVPFEPAAAGGGGWREEVGSRFAERHRELYGYATEEQVVVSAVGLHAVGSTPRPVPEEELPAARRPVEPSATRPGYRGRTAGFGPIGVWPREGLVPGDVVAGPGVIEGNDTAVVVLDGWRARAGASGSLLLDRADRPVPGRASP